MRLLRFVIGIIFILVIMTSLEWVDVMSAISWIVEHIVSFFLRVVTFLYDLMA